MSTATDIARALKVKYSGEEWRLWFEVNEGTGGYMGRRADAFAMNIWPSKGYQTHCFEIKVSRADFKKEMEDLTKSEAIGKYATFFWLVVPNGLVAPEEVPKNWGLMTLQKNGLRIKKQAPAHSPEPMDRPFIASLCRSLTVDKVPESNADVQDRIDQAVKVQVENAMRKHNTNLQHLEYSLEKTGKWKAEFEAALGVKFNVYSKPAALAEKLMLIGRADDRQWNNILSSIKRINSAADDVDAALNSIKNEVTQ